jgi:hypothetical protein
LVFLVGGEASREADPSLTAEARELSRPDREDEEEEALPPGLVVRFRTVPEEEELS